MSCEPGTGLLSGIEDKGGMWYQLGPLENNTIAIPQELYTFSLKLHLFMGGMAWFNSSVLNNFHTFVNKSLRELEP
jgi:hypothetical protein